MEEETESLILIDEDFEVQFSLLLSLKVFVFGAVLQSHHKRY